MSRMNIDITVYKETGKYYTNDIVKYQRNTDYPLLDADFTQWLNDNLPAKISKGFVVVSAAEDTGLFGSPNTGFCEALFKLDGNGCIIL